MKFQGQVVALIVATAVAVSLCEASAGNGPSAGYAAYNGYNYQQQQSQQGWYDQRSGQEELQQQEYEQLHHQQPTGQDEASYDATEERPPLPEGWSEHFDPNSGNYYYYNAADGTTTWDRPETPQDLDEKPDISPPEKNEAPESEQEPTYQPDGGDEQMVADRDQGRESPFELQEPVETQNEMRYENQRSGSAWGMPEVEMKRTPEQATEWAESPDRRQIVQHLGDRGATQMSQTQPGRDLPSQHISPERNWAERPMLREPTVDLDRQEGMPQELPQQRPQESSRQLAGWGLPSDRYSESTQMHPPQQSGWGASAFDEGREHPSGTTGPGTSSANQQAKPHPGWGLADQPESLSPQQRILPEERAGLQTHPEQRRAPDSTEVGGLTTSVPPSATKSYSSPPTSPHSGYQYGGPGGPRSGQQQQIPQLQQQQPQQQQPQQQPKQQQQTQQQLTLQQGPPRQLPQFGAQAHTQQSHAQQPSAVGKPVSQRPPHQQQQPNPYGQYGQYSQGQGYAQYGQYGGQPQYGQYAASQHGYSQQPQARQQNTGQLVEESTAVVKEALTTAWQGLLGFGNRTKEAVEHARETVVSSATAAGKTLTEQSTSKDHLSDVPFHRSTV